MAGLCTTMPEMVKKWKLSLEKITIHELELIKFITEDEFTLRVLSSKGTYIRSLAHDIGQKLGCGAHLSGLTRIKTNHFNILQSNTLDELSNIIPDELMSLLLPLMY